MKLKELIETLNKLQEEHGNMPVYCYDDLEEHTIKVRGRTYIGTAQELEGRFYNAGDSDLGIDIKGNQVTADGKVLILQ